MLLGAGIVGRAQDAALEERVNKLNGLVQDLQESRDNQKKLIDSLAKEIDRLREQQTRPNASYASQEDLKRLTDALNEIEKKRQADNAAIAEKFDRLGKEIGNLGRSTSGSMPPAKKSPKSQTPPPDKTGSGGAQSTKETGYEYPVQPNDTLTSIAKKYNTDPASKWASSSLKLTPEDILKANPGLEERKLMAGKKIWIPAPPDGTDAPKKAPNAA